MFLTQLDAEFDRDKRTAHLLSPLKYQTPAGRIITAEAGFTTDFASVPRQFWSLLDPTDACIRDAAVIHDWLYTTHEMSRRDADLVLIDGMKDLGASWYQRAVVFSAVRTFGTYSWTKP